MDETYGTNNSKMGLSAVLAEFGGAGIPVAYLLVDVEEDAEGKRKADAGAYAHIFQQFLGRLRAFPFSPSFFGCDKDPAEIFAVQAVFTQITIQLCYWHARRAIRMRIEDTCRRICSGQLAWSWSKLTILSSTITDKLSDF